MTTSDESGAAVHMGTFRMARSMVTWNFDVPLLEDEVPQAGLRRAALAVVDCLGAFGEISRVTISSESRGEHGRKLEAPTVDRATIAQSLDELRDAYTIDYDLGLCVTDAEGREHVLERGAKLTLVLDEVSPGKLELYLNVTLNTDVYAGRTMMPAPTHNPLGKLNAPRLGGFLARLRESVSTRLYDLEADWYRSQVDEDGFVTLAERV